MEVAETTTGQDVQKSSSSTSENVKEMSFEKTAHGTVQSQLQLQKSAEQSVEKSLNATKIQSVGVEKSHKSTESVSTSVKIAEVVNGETDVSVSTTIKLAPKTEEVEEEEEEEEEEEIEEEEEEDEEEEEVVVVEAKKQTVITQSEAPVAQSNEASADTATKSVPEPAPALSTSSQETQNESKAVEKTEISSSAQESESIESIAKISPSEPANESVAETIKETRTQSTIVRQPTVEESKAVSEQPKEIIPAPQELSTEQKSPVEVSSVSNQTNEFPVTESFSQLRISEKPASTQTLEFEPSRPLTSSVAATVAAPSVAPPFAAPTVAPPVAAPMPAPPVSAFTPAAQPIVSSSQSQQIQQESIKKQLKEIVSDIDRAIEQQQQETVQAPQSIYSSGPVQSTLTSQSSTTTEIHKKTTTSSILSPPSYFYQEDTSSATPSSLTKPIDLQKIFTPASDAEEIVPQKNRKLYASSAFFTPGLHPTVEDQVELARRISSSLSDANNKLSKGQTMYVNRKKRSVKWVHEGEGKNEVSNQNGYGDYKSPLSQYTSSDEQSYSTHRYESKLPLKLVMDPRGIVQDVHNQGITYDHSSGMLSPDKCAELVSALHTDTPKGKGAELFAKRRKRSEKWIVDETTRSTSSPGATSYSAGPTQLYDTANQYGQSKLLDKQVSYQQPSWEVPYESTRREDSFRQNAYSSAPLSAVQPPYQPSAQSFSLPKQSMQPLKKLPNSQRDLAYKPSVPQGWNAPPPSLPNVGIENQSDNSDEMDTAKPQLTDNNDKKIINHRLDADSNEAIDAKMKSNHLYETNAIDYFIQTKESLRHVPQAHNESNGRVSQQKISDTQLSQNNDDDCGDDEHENYVKIPVQQLICTFEKQMRSVIKQKINENIQIKLENLIDSKTIKANSGKQTAMKTERDLSESLSETQSNIKSSIFTCETDTFVKNLNTTSDAVCNNFTQQQNHKFEGECVTSFNGLNQLPFEANNSSKQLNDNSPKTGDWSDNRFDLPLPVAESNTADVAESSAIETDDFHGEMFTPPEIPLSGYCPPQTDAYLPPSQTTHQRENYYQPPQQSLPHYQAPVSDLYASTRPVATAPAPPTYKKLQPSQIYSPSQTTPNLTPKPFTPSPISNEKLAIFEPAIQYQAPIIRRPLTIPNQVVRNVSPTPFGSRYGPTSATKTKSAAINISSQQHQSQQQPQAYSNDSFNAPDPYQCQPWQSYESTKRSQQTNRLSGCSFTSSSTGNYATMAPASSSSLAQSPRISLDVSAQENYNRAARGWGQTKDFYRPITFAKPHQVELPYSDF